MLVKKTPDNQITLPQAVVDGIAASDCFEVETIGGRIVLTPVATGNAEAARDAVGELGLTQEDVADAVKWARRA